MKSSGETTKDFEKDMDEQIGKDIDLSPRIDIVGIEDFTVKDLPIPYVRVVQSQSKKITTADGTDAPEGTFFFQDTKTAVKELDFILLKSKIITTNFERDGKLLPTQQRKLLGIQEGTEKMFMLSLSIMSFASFARLVAALHEARAKASWEYVIHAVTRKTENEKGKFYVVDFTLKDKVDNQRKAKLDQTFSLYVDLLEERKQLPEQEVNDQDEAVQ